MDLKYKIIIVIFIVLLFLYASYFLFNYYNTKATKKTQEAFTIEDDDDVEHYEEPPVSTKKKVDPPSEYDQRVFILDEIEKLNIDDKEIKGKLMETLFSEATLTKMNGMTTKAKNIFIKKEYDSLAAPAEPAPPAAPAAPPAEPAAPPVAPTVPIPPKKSTFFNEPISMTSIASKTKEAISLLTSAQTEINKIVNKKSTFISSPEEEEEEEEMKFPSVEGFENVPSYASYKRFNS